MTPGAQRQSAGGALAGIRVLDLSRVLGGPLAAQMLADHGADVIKIEPPGGDETRDMGPPFHEGTASIFINVNRNKRGMALDLASEGGRGVLLRLLERADIVVEISSRARWSDGASVTTSCRGVSRA